MQRIPRPLKNAQATNRLAFERQRFHTIQAAEKLRASIPALVHQPVASYHTISGGVSLQTLQRPPARPLTWKKPILSDLSEHSIWTTHGRLGLGISVNSISEALGVDVSSSLSPSILQNLRELATRVNLDDLPSWVEFNTRARAEYGLDGGWGVFCLMKERKQLQLLSEPEAFSLKDEIFAAAIQDDMRLLALVDSICQLGAFAKSSWSALYRKTLHCLLESCEYERAVLWHLRLAKVLPPNDNEVSAILSTFVTDPTPELQSFLSSLYVFSENREQYDRIVPLLFYAGQSRAAREWRKTFLLYGDRPNSAKSRQFLEFLSIYHPEIPLHDTELATLENRQGLPHNLAGDGEIKSGQGLVTHSSRDAFMARWFASTWIPVDFALQLVQRVGLRVVEARALQSLALRENSASGVASRLKELEDLGVQVSSQIYCKALRSFATRREEALLSELLHCDVHPDEFEDAASRRMLLASAVKSQDWKQERMLREIEWIVEKSFLPEQFSALLTKELSAGNSSKLKAVIDRMDAMKIQLGTSTAGQLLIRTFEGITDHPRHWARTGGGRNLPLTERDARLDTAIEMTRFLAGRQFAIPTRCWKVLLLNLGRLGRFNQLEQLSLEIVQLYSSYNDGGVPIHDEDVPINRLLSRARADSQRTWPENLNGKDSGSLTDLVMRKSITSRLANSTKRRDVLEPIKTTDPQYIPADLSFTHQRHPLRLIFSPRMMQFIVICGFDKEFGTQQTSSVWQSFRQSPRPSSIARDEVACGVGLAANLRDLGVPVATEAIRDAALRCLAVAWMGTHERTGRTRVPLKDSDRQWHTVQRIKSIFDETWGSELVPNESELRRIVENRETALIRHVRQRLKRNSSKVFQATYSSRFKK